MTSSDVLICQLKKLFLEKQISGAVVGISGGKDSTIVAALMVEVLGKENVVGVLMPKGIQSDISDSYRVVKLLGIPSVIVNIENMFATFCTELNTSLRKNCVGVSTLSESAIINISPRLRMTTLYGIAQSMGHGWRVIGTTNKSEEYVGWVTKWGDGGCDIEPIIHLTVTELLTLGKTMNIPYDLIDKTPLDGLADGSDESRFGFTYAELDNYILTGSSGKEYVDEKIRKMHVQSSHKRHLIPCVKI